MAKILIVDDHDIVRKGLLQILQDEPDVERVDEARNASELFEQLEQNEYDLIILDITLPGRSGLDVMKDINDRYAEIPVLILSMHAEEQYAVRALRAGAFGYINKQSASEELVFAIRKILQGDRYISETVADHLASHVSSPNGHDPLKKLSDREYEVLHLTASGLSVSDIAEKMCLSPKTISTYRTRLLSKLHLKNTAELVRFALQQGIE